MLYFRKFLYLTILLLVTNCGLRPMYKVDDSGNSLDQKFSQIKIQTTNNSSLAQNLRMFLESNLHNHSKDSQKYRYILTIDPKEELSNTTVLVSGEVARYNNKLIVNYRLQDTINSQIIDQGVMTNSSPYDALSSAYADYTSLEYSTQNNIREINLNLRNRLGIIFLNLENENRSARN